MKNGNANKFESCDISVVASWKAEWLCGNYHTEGLESENLISCGNERNVLSLMTTLACSGAEFTCIYFSL